MSLANPALHIDGYKLDHRRQYPEGTSAVYSNWTPRSSRIEGIDSVVFFGLQYFLREHLGSRWDHGFFERPRDSVLERYKRRVDSYLGPNEVGVSHIGALHELGYLPLEFRALPEGTRVPLRCPMFTVESTHPDFAWLVNYIETLLSCELWLPCTSATTALRYRELLDRAARRSGGDPAFVPWQGHDFSMRGMAGLEAAQLSGAGHLLSFTGTDTLPALDLIEEHYHGENGLVGGSVAATEHSVMCAGGKESEAETFRRLLKLYPSGIVSVVSDTWDFWHVLTAILPSLHSEIMGRDGKLVIRPDSGDPCNIICGDPMAAPGTPAHKGAVRLLWEEFGGTTKPDGYRTLDPHVGLIYGDAITFERAKVICERLQSMGFASTNVVFGIGSYTYQYVTRDTFGFAMKATWARVANEPRELFKKPVTDNGTKHSATGRLAVLRRGGGLQLVDRATPADELASALEPVWRNGQSLRHQSFAEVRSVLHPDWKSGQ